MKTCRELDGTGASARKIRATHGFLSLAAKRQGVKIASIRNEAGERVYKLER